MLPARPNFAPADPGTAEDEWRASLAPIPCWYPPPGDLIVVSPHPDDEVLGVGGLMGMIGRDSRSVTVISVTDGENAYEDAADLAEVRRAELRRALALLSPRINVKSLHIPDGQVAAHRSVLVKAVGEVLTPGSTLVLPFEHDGHCDHEAVGSLRTEFPHVAVVRFPIWLWHHAHPHSVAHLRFGRVDLSTTIQRAKANAIDCFKSQISPQGRLPILPPHVLAHFYRPYEILVL